MDCVAIFGCDLCKCINLELLNMQGKLRRFIDGCLIAIIKFDETRKPEYFVKMKNSMERFVKTLEQLERESNSL